jgi:hypothetical protein
VSRKPGGASSFRPLHRIVCAGIRSEIAKVAAKGESRLPTWIIPGERMKAERQHRVPLTE